MTVRLFPTLLGIGCLVALAGCGQSNAKAVYPVQGRVVVNGKPAPGAFVTLHTVGQSDAAKPTARTNEAGEFTLTTETTGDGAPAGDYTVTVLYAVSTSTSRNPSEGEAAAFRSLLPDIYQNPTSTPLKATVKSGSNDPLVLDIKTTRR